MPSKRLGARNWIAIILIGLVGQLSWAIENNYINLWVYSQSQDTLYVTLMTITSALAATLTTLFMGCLSDRFGKRKVFIAGGYIAWGVSVFLFGLINYHNMLNLVGPAMAITMVGTFMVLADILMTFFGSTANDACFSSYLTDVGDSSNRSKIESVNAVLPLFGNIIIVLVAGLMGCVSYLDDVAFPESADELSGPWFYFFLVFGIIIFVMGVASLFLLPKDKIAPNKDASFWTSLTYGFRPSVVKERKVLYIALVAFMAYNCAINSFMPYWMIYFQNPSTAGGVGLEGMDFYIAVGCILLIASIIAVVGGFFMDKIGRMKVLLPALGLTVLGFLLIFFAKNMAFLIVSGIIMMSGYLLSTAVLGAEIRDLTPKDRVGLFQGVRMIFVVLIPMIIGPAISQLTFSVSAAYVDSYGQTGSPAPNGYMFLVALGFALLSLAPIIWLLLTKKKEAEAPKQANPC